MQKIIAQALAPNSLLHGLLLAALVAFGGIIMLRKRAFIWVNTLYILFLRIAEALYVDVQDFFKF